MYLEVQHLEPEIAVNFLNKLLANNKLQLAVFVVFSLSITAWILYILYSSKGVYDTGDGIQHYQISRYSWQHPELLLDHWGKPLFTLLSSPFAQFGYKGIGVFNVLLFLSTCLMAFDALRRLHLHWASSLLFAGLVITAPQYIQMVLAGMTEILFAFLSMLVIWLAVRKKYRWMAVAASFMLFSRPESAAFLPVAIAWICWKKEWRIIPWFFTGLVLYSILGAFHYGDITWFFTANPYTGAQDIYGSGPLDHFYQHRKQIFGGYFFWSFVASLLILGIIYWKRPNTRSELLMIAALAIVPAVGTFAVHSYAWYKGINGSLGLIRVLATTVPAAAFVVSYTVGKAIPILPERTILRSGVSLLFVGVLTTSNYNQMRSVTIMPLPATEQQLHMNQVASWVKENRPEDTGIAYLNPYLGFRSEIDPFSDRTHLIWGLDLGQEFAGLEKGDWLIWDGHFAPNEGRFPLERALSNDFEVLAYFPPIQEMRVLGGYLFEIFVLRASKKEQITQTQRLNLDAQHARRSDDPQFPLTWENHVDDRGDYRFREVDIIPFGIVGSISEAHLTYSAYDGDQLLMHRSIQLKTSLDTLHIRLPNWGKDIHEKVYVWFPQADVQDIEYSLKVIERRISYAE